MPARAKLVMTVSEWFALLGPLIWWLTTGPKTTPKTKPQLLLHLKKSHPFFRPAIAEYQKSRYPSQLIKKCTTKIEKHMFRLIEACDHGQDNLLAAIHELIMFKVQSTSGYSNRCYVTYSDGYFTVGYHQEVPMKAPKATRETTRIALEKLATSLYAK